MHSDCFVVVVVVFCQYFDKPSRWIHPLYLFNSNFYGKEKLFRKHENLVCSTDASTVFRNILTNHRNGFILCIVSNSNFQRHRKKHLANMRILFIRQAFRLFFVFRKYFYKTSKWIHIVHRF